MLICIVQKVTEKMSKKPNSGSAAALHKVIMVGSGGVGKSAVSLRNFKFRMSSFLMTQNLSHRTAHTPIHVRRIC